MECWNLSSMRWLTEEILTKNWVLCLKNLIKEGEAREKFPFPIPLVLDLVFRPIIYQVRLDFFVDGLPGPFQTQGA